MPRGQQAAVRLFRALFAHHSAHIAMLDTDGVILAVNEAWTTFGRANGLADDYLFAKQDYLDVCVKAAAERSPHAQEAMVGLLGVLKAGRPSYSMLYPCHSPAEHRWFRMWVQTQQPEVPAVVVAHTYVGRERSSEKGKDTRSRGAHPTPGQSAAPPRVLPGEPWNRGGAALCPGVDLQPAPSENAGRPLWSGRRSEFTIDYPWLHIGLSGFAAGAGAPPLAARSI